MTNQQPPANNDITEADIANYLRQHPGFFNHYPSLLADMEIPHDAGGAISLVERQVSVLRDRNIDMRHRLSKLLGNARENDKLFEKTKRLILSLLEAEDLGDIIDALFYSFTHEFDIQHTSLLLYGHPQQLVTDGARLVSLTDAQQCIGRIINNSSAICGQLDIIEQDFIFAAQAAYIGSSAVVPLSHSAPLGVLAIGHEEAQHYRSSMGTIFLSYIGEVLCRVLPRHIN